MVNFLAGKNKMKYSSFAMISILLISLPSIAFQVQLQIKEAVPDMTDFSVDRYNDLAVETRFEDKILFHTPVAEEFVQTPLVQYADALSDTTPPAAPSIANSSFTTVNPTPKIVGKAEGNSIVKLFDGTTQVGNTTAIPSSTASFVADLAVGHLPWSVAVGDFNGDGKQDLAVANYASSSVSVLLGTGTGSFGPATNFAAGLLSMYVTVGDFNGDGKQDLAVYNGADSNVSILLGTGTGSFGAPSNFAVGSGSTVATVGDFNGDGKQDLAAAHYGSNNISVLLGTGTGSFGPAGYFVTGNRPGSVAVGDFNGDGKQDLAVANSDSNNVPVLLGTGTGSFGPASNFAVGGHPISVTVGDFNGDGKQDLAVANRDADNVSVLLGLGNGSFQDASNFLVGITPLSVAVGDFNGDGKQDLAVANYGSEDEYAYSNSDVSVLLGTGTGSFGPASNFAVGGHPRSVVVGDFNGDGKQDLAVANYSINLNGYHNEEVSVLLGTGTGSFAATALVAGNRPTSVTAGDFDGDGKQDLAVANRDSNDVSILLGTGTGSFGAVTNLPAGLTPDSVTAGDFDGDGKQDLAVANYGSDDVSVLLVLAGGSFGAATNFAVGTGPLSVAVGDFDGDGKQDLAVANYHSDDVSILLGLGNGSFGAATNFAVGTGPRSVTAGDFDGDGKQDLAVANYGSDDVSILLGTSTGSFGATRNFAVGNHSTANFRSNDTSIVGTGSFGPASNFAVGGHPISVAVGDFNGDGKQDLAVANYHPNRASILLGVVSVLLGLGNGSFQDASNFAVGTVPTSVTAGDFDGDGKQDLAVANYDSNYVSVLFDTTVGNWSIITRPLSAGAHVIQANATDAAGNTSPNSKAITARICGFLGEDTSSSLEIEPAPSARIFPPPCP